MSSASDHERIGEPSELTAKARSWWSGVRNFLIVGALALVASGGLALTVEHRYAAPLCVQYATEHGLTYQGLQYPLLDNSSSTMSSSGECRLLDAAGRPDAVSLTRLEKRGIIALLVTVALQIEFTTPVAFVALALLAVAFSKRKGRTPAPR